MRKALLISALFSASLFCNRARADEYLWEGGATGNFSDSKWFNVTANKHNVGPPGKNDRADDENGATLTINGGQVQTLEGTGGSGFDVQDDFTVGTLLACGPTITGPATLEASTVTCNRGGVSDFMIQSGSLYVTGNISNASPFVSGGGVLVVFGAPRDVTFSASGTGSFITTGGFDDVSILVSNGARIATRDVLNGKSGITSTLDGAGSVLDVDDVALIDDGFLDMTNGAQLKVGGDLSVAAPNSGNAALTVSSGSIVSVGSVLTVSSPAEVALSISGSIRVGQGAQPAPNTMLVDPGGIVRCSGRVAGQVVNDGRISPDSPPGIFKIDGSFQQKVDATFQAELGSVVPGTGYNQLSVTGTATLGGTLSVDLVNGFTPSVGQTFRLVNAGSVSGTFTTIVPPSQAGISVTTDAVGVTLRITSVVAGAPVISSPTSADATVGTPFSYQITATKNPTSFGAASLPPGLTVNPSTGVISGTPTTAGASVIRISANNAAGSGQADLIIVASQSSGAGIVPASLGNISTRLGVLTGNNVGIGGFIVSGTVPKNMVIRGLGPSLTPFGVPNVLADPVLSLHTKNGQGADVTLATNDSWKINAANGQSQEAAVMGTGKAPKNDVEAAILATLNPGSYTVILTGKNNGTGNALLDVYDLNGGGTAFVTNISTRGFVNTGNDVMIGGFILGQGGIGSATVMVRVLGPALGQFGINNFLADPTLELRDVNGALVASNDDWQSDAQSNQVPPNLKPPSAKESALHRSLSPGSYTAIVRGKNNTTGVALVEVYYLP